MLDLLTSLEISPQIVFGDVINSFDLKNLTKDQINTLNK